VSHSASIWSYPSFACNFARRSSVHCPQISEHTFSGSSPKRSSLQTMVSTIFVHLRFSVSLAPVAGSLGYSKVGRISVFAAVLASELQVRPTFSATSLVVLVQPSTWLQAEQSQISPISSSHLPVNFFSLGADSVGLAGPRLFHSLRGLCPERPDGLDEPDPLLDPPACWPASAGPAAGVLSSLF
jgi:hypothetical protein